MAWSLAFLYTQVAIVNNTKLSSPGEGKLPLKLAVIEIEPRPSFQTWSSRQPCMWKDARSETANIFLKALQLFEMGWDKLCSVWTSHAFAWYPFYLTIFRKRNRTNSCHLLRVEQNVDQEKVRMLRIYIGLLLLLPSFTTTTTTFLSFSSSITTNTFLLFSFSTTTTTRFRYFLPPPLPPDFYRFLLPPPLPHFYYFPPSNSIKDRKLSQLVQFVAMSQVIKKTRRFLQLLAVCPAHQRQFLLRTATPRQLHVLVQALYNVLKEYILIPEESKRKVF